MSQHLTTGHKLKISLSPRALSRTGVAVSTAAFLALGLAAPAAAEPGDDHVRAQYVSAHQSGGAVQMDGRTIGTTLFNLQVENGGTLITYCIDIETGIRLNAWYNEDDWANYPGKGAFAEPGKVLWILQNSYPTLSSNELQSAIGTNARISDQDALAGTQAAIWHFSNGATLDDRNRPAVKEVYDYLVENAQELEQTPASLSVTPDSATGTAGETIGEFQISTSASDIPVDLSAPEGVELVDLATGEAVTSVNDGDKVGFAVSEDAEAGEASFKLETSSTIQKGRLFKGEHATKATQTLITAEDSEVSVKAGAHVEWSAADQPAPEPSPEPEEPEEIDEPDPKPNPEETPEEEPTPEDDKPAPGKEDDEPKLPVTGGALAGLVAAGIAALGAGGGALYLSRKRKAAAEDIAG